jgi:hypothetical protein
MRDLFAAFALAGMLAEREMANFSLTARYAYQYADALIEQRNKDATGL